MKACRSTAKHISFRVSSPLRAVANVWGRKGRRHIGRDRIVFLLAINVLNIASSIGWWRYIDTAVLTDFFSVTWRIVTNSQRRLRNFWLKMSGGVIRGPAGNNDCRIYVGNLPPDIRTKDVEDVFYKYGAIRDIDLKNRRGGPPFAFVEFEDPR